MRTESFIFRYATLILGFLLVGCASVSEEQGLKAVTKSGYSDVYYVYIDAPNDAISSALMAAHLKISKSTTSELLVQMLRVSDKRPAAVAGRSINVTNATIRRALDDVGLGLPRNGKLLIVGNASDHAEVTQFAISRGMTVDVISPVAVTGGLEAVKVSSVNQATKLQNSVQKNSNAQMNELLKKSN